MILQVTPLWMVEQESLSDEDHRIDAGAEPRDMSERSVWRDTTDGCVQDALRFYGENLVGQTCGFSDALSLAAVMAAFDIEGVPQEDRPELKRRMVLIHGAAMEEAKRRHRMSKRG